MKLAEAYADSEPQGVNLDLINSVLPVLKYTTIVFRGITIILAILFIKYPRVARFFYLFEVFIMLQFSFVIYDSQEPTMRKGYFFLLYNYLSLQSLTLRLNLISTAVYALFFIVVQC